MAPRRPKTPQHATFVSPSPSLTYGQVAALNHIVRGWLEADADMILQEGVLENIRTLVDAGEAFDPLMEGINTPNDLFIARTTYWALQAVAALEPWGQPHAMRVSRATIKTKGKRQAQTAPSVMEWLDEKEQSVDTFERKDDADADT